jgi:hypothetical protein
MRQEMYEFRWETLVKRPLLKSKNGGRVLEFYSKVMHSLLFNLTIFIY